MNVQETIDVLQALVNAGITDLPFRSGESAEEMSLAIPTPEKVQEDEEDACIEAFRI